MEGKITLSIENLSKVVLDILNKVGVKKNDSRIILNTILFANKRGIATHGIGRLPLYIHKINAGHFNPKNEIEIIIDKYAYGLIDAHNGFGQLSAFKATEIAIKKAKTYGIGIVGVRNSNNFGTAGFFGDMAARQNCASIIFANAAPALVPTGGNKPIFGTNPICFSFPGNKNYNPILLDMATTTVARGKIRLAAKNKEKIPMDWGLGPDGKPTDDPKEVLLGSLLPIGGYKGYGLSMFVDIFAGLLTGSSYAGNVKNLSQLNEDSGNGHLFITIDISKFMSSVERNRRLKYFYDSVKSCGEIGKVYMPGEIGYNKMLQSKEFIQISAKQFEEIRDLTQKLKSKYTLNPLFQ